MMSTNKIPHGVRNRSILLEADGLEPVNMTELVLPLVDNFIVESFDLPARLVGDLLDEPEHGQLANRQRVGFPILVKKRREPRGGEHVVSHRRQELERQAIAGTGKGLGFGFGFHFRSFP